MENTIDELHKKRQNVIYNYVKIGVRRLQKELQSIWKNQGKSKKEIEVIYNMKRIEVCSELVNYYNGEIKLLESKQSKSAG